MAGALDPSTVCEMYQDHLGPRIAEVSGVQVIQGCLFHIVVGQGIVRLG